MTALPIFPRLLRQPIYRHFTASVAAHSLKVINPRLDASGSPMTVTPTPRAINRLLTLAQQDKNPSLALRITVESGGCHGFQYTLSLTDTSKIDASEDTVFEEDGGVTMGERDYKARLVMDEASLELLKGSKVDYTMELIGSQFRVVDNPKASSSCGCGTSFDIKDLEF